MEEGERGEITKTQTPGKPIRSHHAEKKIDKSSLVDEVNLEN